MYHTFTNLWLQKKSFIEEKQKEFRSSTKSSPSSNAKSSTTQKTSTKSSITQESKPTNFERKPSGGTLEKKNSYQRTDTTESVSRKSSAEISQSTYTTSQGKIELHSPFASLWHLVIVKASRSRGRGFNSWSRRVLWQLIRFLNWYLHYVYLGTNMCI